MDTKTKNRLNTGLGAAVAVAFTIGAVFALAPLYNIGADSPADGGTPSVVKVFRGVGEAPEPDPTLTPTPSATAEPAAPAPAPIVEQPAPAAPVKCPAGTVAGAVDGAGNESNCYETNAGQQCVAYDDANNCTQWYKP